MMPEGEHDNTLYKYLKGSCMKKGKKVTHAPAVGVL